jgi:hypothetical protein
MKPTVLAAVLVFGLGGVASVAGDGGVAPRIAFFGFHLINTSLEPTASSENQRILMLDDLFRKTVGASDRFRLIAISPDMNKAIAVRPEIGGCNGCERDFAKRAGADWAAWGTVQKVSNLILNINVHMEDVETGKMEFVKSVDIRGNTDETWRHGLTYMLRHYLFGEP